MIILKRVSDDPYIYVTDIYDVHKIANVEKKVPRTLDPMKSGHSSNRRIM